MTTGLRLIRPIDVNDTTLLSSNVSELDAGPAQWVVGTTYAKSAQVFMASTQKIYISLAAANVGHSPDTSYSWWSVVGEASLSPPPTEWGSAVAYVKDDRVYSASTGLVYVSQQGANQAHDPTTDTTKTWWRPGGVITGAAYDPPAWVSGTTYAQDARVSIVNTHMIYVSVHDENSANDPATDTLLSHWVPVSVTNKWKAFDQRNTSQTRRVGGMDLTIKPLVAVSGIAMLNTQNVVSVQVTMTDPTDGVVYNKTTVIPQAPPSEASAFAHCFDQISPGDLVIAMDLPSYAFASIRIQAFTADSTLVVAIGVISIGTILTIGNGVNYGAKVGIQDYSRKEANQYGDYTVVERAYSKRASFNLWVPRLQVDPVMVSLAQVRAVACVWIGVSEYQSTIIFGFFKDFDISIQYYDYSVLDITIEGLT